MPSPALTEISPPGSMLYYSLLFCRNDQKALLTTIHGIYQEILAIPGECRDQNVAAHKLNFWEQEFERFSQNQAQHPLVVYLQNLNFISKQDPATRLQIFSYLNALIDASANLLMQQHFTDWEAWQQFAKATWSSRERLCTYALDTKDFKDKTIFENLITQLGVFFGLVDMLIHLHRNLRHGFITIPLDFLKQHGLDEKTLGNPKIDQLHRELYQNIFHRVEDTLQNITDIIKTQPLLKRPLEPRLILMRLQKKLLDEIARDDFGIMRQQYSLPPIRQFFSVLKWHYLG